MHDSLELFGNITHLSYFRETSIILFLNKMDIFEEKLKYIPLTRTFAEYQGMCIYIVVQNVKLFKQKSNFKDHKVSRKLRII